MGRFMLFIFLFVCPVSLQAQPDRKYIREGNRDYKKEKYGESEVAYRKALEKVNDSYKAGFNLGNALYKQERYDDASGEYGKLSDKLDSRTDRSKLYHNIGNTLLQSGKLQESIEAYKEALRNNPLDTETKYNLSYAQRLLKEQQQQQQQQGQGDQKQDQQRQDQQEKDQQQPDQQKNDQQQDQQQQQDQPQQNQQQSGQISKENAERILEALANKEKDVMEKYNKMKAKAKKARSEKEW